jgi:hypothetical protein
LHGAIRGPPMSTRWVPGGAQPSATRVGHARCSAPRMGRALATWVTLLASACRSALPEPPIGPSPGEALVDVTSPPPAAHVEYVPPRPRKDAVWIDGQWTWDGSWRWEPGGWVAPPPGARFAPWRTFRRVDGTLAFASAAWIGARGEVIASPAVLRPATSARAAQEPETPPGVGPTSTPNSPAKSP